MALWVRSKIVVFASECRCRWFGNMGLVGQLGVVVALVGHHAVVGWVRFA